MDFVTRMTDPEPQPASAPRQPNPTKRRRNRKKRWFLFVLILLIIASGAWQHWHRSISPTHTPAKVSPVPANIALAVSFPIYYPDAKKLPAGYSLDLTSFKSPVKNGVTYVVTYGNGKRIVFSVQTKPPDNELQSFNASYIPLRIDYQTPIGQAEIGAYNNHGDVQTLVSLPTQTDSWIVITAPYDINQGQLKQVLNSLKQ